MNTKLLLLIAVLFAGMTLNSCGVSDEKLQKDVTAALSAVSSSLTSEVKKGEVTLNGIVEAPELKALAEKIVTAVKGVKSVVNKIEVQLPKPKINPDDELKNIISTAITAAGEAYNKVVVAVKEGEVTLTGEVKRADLQKLIQIANEAKPKKVINELTISK